MAPARTRSYIRHLHSFRGFAIISVVLTHAFTHQAWDAGGPSTGDPSLMYAVTQSLFYNSTVYFTLISGLVFSVALQKRGWASFFTSKFKYVIVPYIAVSLIYFGLLWNTLDPAGQAAVTAHGPSGVIAHFGEMLLLGGAMYQLWYVPVVGVLFLMTPLLVAILDNPRLRWLCWLVILAPLVISRDFTHPSWTNIVYFAGAYLAGIMIGRHYTAALETFRIWMPWLCAAAIILVAVEIGLHLTGIDKEGVTSLRETGFYVLRLVLSAIVLRLMCTWESRLPKWLDTLATYAFTIYFLHVAILMLFDRYVDTLFAPEALTLPVMTGLALAASVLALVGSVAIGKGAKYLLGERARYLLGS